MVADRSALHLKHMLDNIERILEWTSHANLEAYGANPMLRDAVGRCLERISEASRRLPDELKATQPQIPWRRAADIGNVLRHEYHDIADTEIWRIARNELPLLRDAVRAMIDAP